MSKIKAFITGHKVWSAVIGLIFVFGAYKVFFKGSASAATQYALATVQQGTLVVSTTGTGQVSNSSSVAIAPQVSGNLTYVNTALQGKFVKTGTVIATIDSTSAQKTLRDAKLNLQKLQASQTTDQPKQQDTITNDQNNLAKTYQSSFNDVSSAFIDLPTTLKNSYGILYGTSLYSTAGCQPDYCAYENLLLTGQREDFETLITAAKNDFLAASASYQQTFNDYKQTSTNASPDQITSLVNETLGTSQLFSQALKSEQTLLSTLTQEMQQNSPGGAIPTAVTNNQATIATTLSQDAGHVATLLNDSSSIVSQNQTLAADQRNLTSLQTTDPLDLQSAENAVADAETQLGYYTVRAPIDGIVSSITGQKGAPAGSSVGTIVSSQQVVDVSLNEVDVAKIADGQQATLTFDAIPGLTLTGKVASIDTVGTVSQGVVDYNVKIAFDAQNGQVKPGMSVTANIITNEKSDAVEVPSGAVKTVNGQSFVQVVQVPASLNGQTTVAVTAVPTPQSTPVTVGISNATMTEVTSGLNPGDVVVVRTITPTSGTTSSSTTGRTGAGNATFFAPGGGAAAGGARALTR